MMPIHARGFVVALTFALAWPPIGGEMIATAAAQQGTQLPNKPGSLKFAAFGDFGNGNAAEYQTAAQLAKTHESFRFELVTTLGDNLLGSERPQDFQNKFEIPYKPLLDAGVKFYASLGNHDAREQRNYGLFNMNGRSYYSFKAPEQDVRFFMLESSYMDPDQVKWIDNELRTSTEEWKIVIFHEPVYSSSVTHGSNLALRTTLEPMFVKYGVSVVLSGHDHVYERIKPQHGITYFVVGSGGELRRGDIRKTTLTDVGFDTDNAFLIAEIIDRSMYFNAISRTGRIVDSGVITLHAAPSPTQLTDSTPVQSQVASAVAAKIAPASPAPGVALQGGAVPGPATFTIAAGPRYQASALHRWLAGATYRDLWVTPIRVPVLDLRTFAGGLHPTKEGGGMQTKSLRLKTASGVEYVFRVTDKTVGATLGRLKDTPAEPIFQDQVSAMHPAGAQISVPIMAASGVLHPSGVLMVMPDDSLLGKFREEFGGRLGIVEEFPNVPDEGPGFGGASKIIDSEELLKLLNADATQHIDTREFLTARLTDFLINDNDRHLGNWKWARMASGPKSEWRPIARDRDHAFVSYDGLFSRIARLAAPALVSFDNVPNVVGLTTSVGFDARLLSGLEKPVWDSVARALQTRITDSVIDAAVHAMPVEYQGSSTNLEAVLRKRRAALPRAAEQFYRMLAARVEVHGTDSVDRAVITRVSDGIVDVRLESAGEPFFSRRFDARETSEILVYLHGGDDSALVTGSIQRSILVRVIGGNGTNTLIDSSSVAGNAHSTRLYDAGTVHNVSYGPDTLFDRRPWERENEALMPPRADHGGGYEPVVGLSLHRLIGVTPRVGIVRYGYGFAQRPYATMVKVEGEYAFAFHGANVGLTADKRLESSPLHFTAFGQMSDLEVVSFHGLGNATIDSGRPSTYYDVHQRRWSLHPTIALAIGPGMDISLGPVIQHAVTDSGRSPYLARTRPYGFGTFDQAGVQATVGYEWRDAADDEGHTPHRILADANALYFPAAMSVRTAFEEAMVALGASTALPIPTHPFLVARAGGKKVYGDFPFHEAATIGGEGTTRYMDTQRYAGDASLYASSELRIPVTRLQLVLPLRVGLLGLAEAGRVYDHGSSPGGWHARTGEGIWVGMRDVSSVVTLAWTTEPGHRAPQLRLGLNDAR